MTRRKNDVETPEAKSPKAKSPKAATLEVFESVTLSVPRSEHGYSPSSEYSFYQVATVDDIQALVTASRARFGCTDDVAVTLAAGSIKVSRKTKP